MSCRPGHPPRHEPFEEGNEVATRHGAHSERRWRPAAECLRSEAIAEAPWLTRPAFRWAVEAWAVAEAKAALVDRYLDEVGLLDDDGTPWPANALSDRLHGRAMALRSQLGLDPVALARLLATFAGVPGGEDALEALKAEGRRLIEARSEAPLPGAPRSAVGERAAQAAVQRPDDAA